MSGVNSGRAPAPPDDDLKNARPDQASPAALIAERAYKKWCARGCPADDDLCDWFEAEREVRRELSETARPAPLPPRPMVQKAKR